MMRSASSLDSCSPRALRHQKYVVMRMAMKAAVEPAGGVN
jgi:hypothetical protein